MAKLSGVPRQAGRSPAAAAAKPGLPDPRMRGPFRPFATDPGRSEAWWWLVLPALVAVFVLASYRADSAWHTAWVTRESGILETGQFIFMVMGLAIAVQLLFDPFVRRRPLILAFFMYFFIFAYLVVFERRIRALAAECTGAGAEG